MLCRNWMVGSQKRKYRSRACCRQRYSLRVRKTLSLSEGDVGSCPRAARPRSSQTRKWDGGVVFASRKIHSGMKRQRDRGAQRRMRRSSGRSDDHWCTAPMSISCLVCIMCRVFVTRLENFCVWVALAEFAREFSTHMLLSIRTLGLISCRRVCTISNLFAMPSSFLMADITTAAACSRSNRSSHSMFVFMKAMSIRLSQQPCIFAFKRIISSAFCVLWNRGRRHSRTQAVKRETRAFLESELGLLADTWNSSLSVR